MSEHSGRPNHGHRAARPDPQASEESGRALSARVRLHAVTPGAPRAPLVAFAHGLEEPWSCWLPVARALHPTWRVIALDLPWRPGTDYSWRRRPAADWLGDALDLLDTRPDVLVAHSFAASAALGLLSAADPRPGSAAVLVCPLYRAPDRPVTWRTFERAHAAFAAHVGEGVRARLGRRAGGLDPAVLNAMAGRALERIGPPGFLTVFQQYIASAELPLGDVAVPTCLLVGGCDPTLSRRAAYTLAARLPDCTLRITDEYDHFCHIRQACGVAAQIADFVVRRTRIAQGEPR